MNLFHILLEGAMVALVGGVMMSVVRLLRGPSIADRAVALDQIAVQVVGIIILYSVRVDDPVYLDAALVVGLIGFLTTLAFARYIERGAKA
jgi:multicomponent Na+:H+ antiporter subunit F